MAATRARTDVLEHRARDVSAEVLTLAVDADGAAVVEVITGGGRCHMYQYRRDEAVVAEASTLRALAAQLERLTFAMTDASNNNLDELSRLFTVEAADPGY